MTYRIKPLVWERDERIDVNHWSASTVIGLYVSFLYFGKPMWKSPSCAKLCDSLEAGKLAAEEHYRERLTGPNGCLLPAGESE